MSFILDALRKSEHERQRSALPSLAQVPVAAPSTQLPRWVVIVMAMLITAVVGLGIAWLRSVQTPATAAPTPVATVERRVSLPPPPPTTTRAATVSSTLAESASARAAEMPARGREQSLAALATPSPVAGVAPSAPAEGGEPALPSAAALAAQGVVLPPLRLELHAFSESPADRFVFINGRRYAEGARLPEGPELVSIEPRGAVLRHAGQRFLLVPE